MALMIDKNIVNDYQSFGVLYGRRIKSDCLSLEVVTDFYIIKYNKNLFTILSWEMYIIKTPTKMNFLRSFLLGFLLFSKSVFKPFLICQTHKNRPTFRNTVAFTQLRPVKGDNH